MLSVITPHYSRTNPYVEEAYASLLRQTCQDWEWVVVLNNGGELSDHIRADARVLALTCPTETSNIGALKRLGCMAAHGEIVVELDADDMLTPDALAEVVMALQDSAVPFCYSNYAEFEHGTWKPNSYSAYWGWESRPWVYEGHELIEMVAMPPTAQGLRTCWFNPNHVRAWRAVDYWAVGGHNADLAVADDYDLCCRFYLHAPMRHIDKCLYLYRRHGDNNTIVQSDVIYAAGMRVYEKYIISLAITWAQREGLKLIDLGGAFGAPAGFVTVDRQDAEICCDLERGIPLPDNSCGVVRANDVLEHLHDPVAIMNEIYRVLVPGGWLLLSVPSTDGRGAFQAPDHVSFWNENSFWYYTNPTFAQYVRTIKCKFQVSRVITWYPSDWHRERDVSYVDAQLIAVKLGYKPIGECLWPSALVGVE